MNYFKDKNIVVGVTGGIAAYKTVDVVSQLKKRGANVYVVMTKSATEFVTPLTFQTLSKNRVITDMFEKNISVEVEHISLAVKADAYLICPATANILGKVANGIADDFLSTNIMATKAPVIFACGMNDNMYDNPIVQENIAKLKKYGYYFVEPEYGFLACGTSGKGRLAPTSVLLDNLENVLCTNKDLSGKKVLVTAGPTRESLDPVRFITNHSSGKMGYEIARAAFLRGAEVVLVSGKTNLSCPLGVDRVDVTSATDMKDAVDKYFDDCDVVIKSAAVADYRPATVSENKIKKSDSDMSLELVKNADILKELGLKKKKQILVGFCMETQDLIENATKKLNSKNLDFIVANDLSQQGSGFGVDTNIITIIDKSGEKTKYDIMSKREVAEVILDKVSDVIK